METGPDEEEVFVFPSTLGLFKIHTGFAAPGDESMLVLLVE